VELSDKHIRKLKQLTMCSLARAQVVPYDQILSALGLPDIRALEDFIIQDCVYNGLLQCKLDQKGRALHVHEVYNRDVAPAELPNLTLGLQQLCGVIPHALAPV
jgi:COP9 signalosome complex subunit 7